MEAKERAYARGRCWWWWKPGREIGDGRVYFREGHFDKTGS